MNLVQNIKPYFFTLLLALFYISEGVAKYFYFLNLERIILPRVIKIIVIVLIFLFFIHKRKFKILVKILVIFCLYILGQFTLFSSEIPWSNLLVVSKYIFPILLLNFSFLYFKNTTNKYFFKSFEVLIVVNSILIIIGFFLKLNFLNTYYGDRFGFDGLFLTSAGASYFYAISTYYLYLKFKKTSYYIGLVLFALVGVFLTGTKALYLFIMFLFIYHITLKNISIKKIVLSLVLCLLLIVLFFLFEPSFLSFIKDKGLLTFILSFRDKLLVNNTLPFIERNWNFANYLFGGLGGKTLRSQLGFVDLFFTLGLIGSIYYLVIFYKSLIKNELTRNTKFVLAALGVLIFLGGNFFFNATIAIYLVILQQVIMGNYKEKMI